MAGTVSATLTGETISRVRKVTWTWTSTAGGAADGPSDPVYGEVVALTTIPGAGGAQPTNLYDITVTDADGTDVMFGAGANRSNASTESVAPTSKNVAFGILTLNVTNAGNAKSGTAVVYVLGP